MPIGTWVAGTRALVAVLSVALVLSPVGPADVAARRAAVAWHAAMLALSLVEGLATVQLRAEEAAQRRLGVLALAVDVLLVATYQAIVQDIPRSGSLLVWFVLFEGPARFGLVGALASGLPLVAVTLFWGAGGVVDSASARALTAAVAAVLAVGAGVVSRALRRAHQTAVEASHRFSRCFANAPIGMALLDGGGHFLQVNRAMTDLLGDEWRWDGLGLADIVHGDDLPAARAAVSTVVSRACDPSRTELRLISPQGEVVHVVASIGRDDDAATSPVLILQLVNVTRRREAVQALRASEERFRALIQHSSDVIVVVDRHGRSTYVSPGSQAVVGLHADSLQGHGGLDHIHPDDLPMIEAAFTEIVDRPRASTRVEYRFRHADGTWRHLEATYTNLLDDPSVAGVVVNAHDVTDRRQVQDLLAFQATHDPLTGLPNRALLHDRLRQALTRLQRRPTGLAVLFCDLDGFKDINDSHGHAAGDRVLVSVARRLTGVLRPSDSVARFGGDEFVIVCEDITQASDVGRIAERILEAVGQPIDLEDGNGRVTVGTSIGAVIAAGPHDDPDALLGAADTAMYRAKRTGKHRSELVDRRLADPGSADPAAAPASPATPRHGTRHRARSRD